MRYSESAAREGRPRHNWWRRQMAVEWRRHAAVVVAAPLVVVILTACGLIEGFRLAVLAIDDTLINMWHGRVGD